MTIVPELGAEWVDDAVALARSLSEEDNMRESPRATALVDLLGRVWQREDVARDALRSIERSISPEQKARLLPLLARHLPRERKIEAFQAADAIEDGEARLKALGNLAAFLPADLVLRAFAAVQATRAPEEPPPAIVDRGAALREAQVTALIALLRHLPDAERARTTEEVIAAALSVRETDEWHMRSPRAHVLASLAEQTSGAAKARVLESALAAARKLSPEGPSGLAPRAAALLAIFERSESGARPALAQEILAALRGAFPPDNDRAAALEAIAQHLPPEERNEELLRIGDATFRLQVLSVRPESWPDATLAEPAAVAMLDWNRELRASLAVKRLGGGPDPDRKARAQAATQVASLLVELCKRDALSAYAAWKAFWHDGATLPRALIFERLPALVAFVDTVDPSGGSAMGERIFDVVQGMAWEAGWPR